jgi:hypothetical protein
MLTTNRTKRQPQAQVQACAACGAERTTEYCGRCGQGPTPRITFQNLFRDSARAVAGLDAPWLRTLRGLATNAGRTVREYVDGVRNRYAHPVGYALATITTYVLSKQLLVPQGSLARLLDPVLWFGAFWPYVSFALLIPAALLLRALFRRVPRTAAEYYVLTLYLAGQVALLETVLVVLARFELSPAALVYAVRALAVLYATGAIVHFTGESRWHGWLRALAGVAGTVVLFVAPFYVVMALILRSLLA